MRVGVHHVLTEGVHQSGPDEDDASIELDVMVEDAFQFCVTHPGPEITMGWLLEIKERHGIPERVIFTIQRMNTPDGVKMKVEFFW